MASLYSLAKNRRLFYMPGCTAEEDRIRERWLSKLRSPSVILVNCQSVADDTIADDGIRVDSCPGGYWRDLHCVTPPFEDMWLEWVHSAGRRKFRVAFQLHRYLADSFTGAREFECLLGPDVKWIIALVHFTEHDGAVAGPLFFAYLSTDASGVIIKKGMTMCGGAAYKNALHHIEYGEEDALFCVLPVAHALCRMNCRNVELHPIAEAKVKPHWKRDIVPASVWHEIKITSVPKMRTTGSAIFPEPRITRAHWIRGHYADYREHGLFGRIKGVFWIPEHRVGDEKLGQVIPEYVIQ